MTNATHRVRFEAIDEPLPGARWRRRFDETWPFYRDWFCHQGLDKRPERSACIAAMREHMPELLPVYEALCAPAGGDDTACRYLSGYGPPPVMPGCSVVVAPGDAPLLIRNYDFSPNFCEGTILRSRWCGRQVIAMVDGSWGVLDGFNDAGLTAALTFGGRPVHGDGFSILIVLRYLLECCDTTADAIEVLRRVPVCMSQNVMLLDQTGDHAVVYLGPDRAAVVDRAPVTTNHQGRVEHPEIAVHTRTVERSDRLRDLYGDPTVSRDRLIGAFAETPLYQTDYDGWLGTLYTAVYDPVGGEVEFRWPSETWRQSFATFDEGARTIRYWPTRRQTSLLCISAPDAVRWRADRTSWSPE